MNEFIRDQKFGMLKIDRIIFEATYPILFVCSNEEKELFLCVCCQNNSKGKKWLITKSSSDTIVKMLKDEITIRDAFLMNPDSRITVDRINGETRIGLDAGNDWSEDSIYLPKKGEYLDADPDEFSEEIAYYQNRKTFSYAERYSNVLSREGDIQSDSEPLSDEMPLVVSEMNVQTISAKIMQTLKSFDQIQLQLDMIQKAMIEYTMNHYVEQIQTFALEKADKEIVELNGNRVTVFFEAA